MIPTWDPIVQLPTVATPSAFVTCVAPVTEPPPTVEKVTVTPLIGLPPASVNLTDGAGDTVLLTVVVVGAVFYAVRVLAPPAMTLNDELVVAVSPDAAARRT